MVRFEGLPCDNRERASEHRLVLHVHIPGVS
jgi:hypothetical protein